MNSPSDNSERLLIVDDDKDILELLSQFLMTHGYQVDTAENSLQAYARISKQDYQLVVLDLMLPGEDGLSICRRLQSQSNIPIVMLTALGDETDRIVGLELGADDYLPKPFNPRELLARIKAVLRRYQSTNDFASQDNPNNAHQSADHGQRNHVLQFDIWHINLARRELKNNRDVITTLTSGEYDLLLAFAENAQTVLTRDQLLDITRGRSAGPFDRSIDVQLSRLRKKIEIDPKNPQIIKTVRNGGYVFTPIIEFQPRLIS